MNKWISYLSALLGWVTGCFVITIWDTPEEAFSGVWDAMFFGAIVTWCIKQND